MQSQPTRALIGGLVEELATAMAALLGAAGSATETPARPPAEWVVRATGVRGSRRATGDWTDRHRTRRHLAKQVMGFDDAPDDAVVGDMLQEACNQAFAALGQTGRRERHQVRRRGARSAPAARATGDVVAALRVDRSVTASRRSWWPGAAWRARRGASAPQPASRRGAAQRQPPPRPHVAASTAQSIHYPNLDVILDIDLPLSVRFGETEMTVDALTQLGPGLRRSTSAGHPTTPSTCSSTAGWWPRAKSSSWRAATACGSPKS